MKKYDRFAAMFFIVLGLATAFYSFYALKLGTLRRPDSGFQPFLAGVGLVLFSAAWLVNRRGVDEEPQPFWGKGEWVRPALAVVFLILYAWTMESLGYVISTLLFMAAWQFLIERAKWLRATVVTGLTTLGMYVVFVQLLGVAVPQGILGS